MESPMWVWALINPGINKRPSQSMDSSLTLDLIFGWIFLNILFWIWILVFAKQNGIPLVDGKELLEYAKVN